MTEKKSTSGWTKVPNSIIEMAEIPHVHFKIYCVILTQKNGLRLTLKDLSKIVGASRSTIQRAIRLLTGVGLLEKIEEQNSANKYIAKFDLSVDNIRDKLINMVTDDHAVMVTGDYLEGTPLVKSDMGDGQTRATPWSPVTRPLVKSDMGDGQKHCDHTRAYSNCSKTSFKTSFKTSSKTSSKTSYILSKTEKKYTFENWQKDVAEAWAAFCRQVRPGLDKIINIDQWANEIRLISDQYKLAEKAWTEILDFVRNDQFWSVNAASIMGLRNRGKSGEHKIVQIISRVPKYKTAAMYKAAEANYDPTRNVLDRSWTTKKE